MNQKNRLFTQMILVYLPVNQAVVTNALTLLFFDTALTEIVANANHAGIDNTKYPNLKYNGIVTLPTHKLTNTLSEQVSV